MNALRRSWRRGILGHGGKPFPGIKSRRFSSPLVPFRALVCAVTIGSVSGALLQTETAEAAPSPWSVTSSPNSAGSQGAYLLGVSCPKPTFCMAVGENYTGSESQTLAETWDGTTWSIDSSPNVGSNLNYLNAVSCARPNFCMAVGYYNNTNTETSRFTLVETWDGSSWSVTTSPSPTGFDDLNGVSCTSSTNCVAVGYTADGTLIESWNGTIWSVISGPSEDTYGQLEGVSCISSSRCIAVGSFINGSGESTVLAEIWNGTRWKITLQANIGTDDLLDGVSCSSSTSCVAVGSQNGAANDGGQTLVEYWNGSLWSVVTSPNHQGIGDTFAGVSCINSTSCVAVGTYFPSLDSDQTLIEIWNGVHWKITASPDPGGSSDGDWNPLVGVSCAKSTFCDAVGTYLNVSVYQSLVETGST